MFGDPGYYMVGMHAVWWLFWIALLAALLIGLRDAWGGRGGGVESPRDLLQRRLAAGEITPDEYEQRMALLNRDG